MYIVLNNWIVILTFLSTDLIDIHAVPVYNPFPQ